MADTGLAMAVAMLFGGTAAFLAVRWFLLPYVADVPCAACGARNQRSQPCAVCGAPPAAPPAAHPGAQGYGFPPPEAPVRAQPRIEGGEAFNRGITKRVVTLATVAMATGIGVRLLGMAGVLGLPSIPVFVDGLLTIAGGVIAFVGFVFLDAA
ncbi:MAG TPA: hypothetical protein VGR28_00475 [Candidatus Thermoplasmatota archaeon]|nr:hypothetical protein [Candidatus Thermoplasmatota archaeon]